MVFQQKPFGKDRFHCQNDWSSSGPASQFWQMESALRLVPNSTFLSDEKHHYSYMLRDMIPKVSEDDEKK